MFRRTKFHLLGITCSLALLPGCADFSINRSPAPVSVSGIVPANYFGMHVGFVTPGTPWPAVPFGTWRLWDANVTWKDLEPQRGVWDFSKLDAFVALAQLHKVDIILPLALTPRWASERPSEPSSYTPGAAAPPSNLQDWIDYVQTVTARYKGKIGYYEMWNEANFAVTWTGTPEQLVNLQQAAYTAIKNNDPKAQLISANIDAMCGLPYLEKLLSLGYANSADIIGYHFYVSPNQPEAIATLASQVASLLSHYGVNKPLWNTETGWLSPSRFTSDDQAAAVVVRAMLVGHSSGIGRFIWYEWDNHCCVTLFMTETDNATPTRAALAYANLQKWLVGNTLGSCAPDEAKTWSCDLRFADGRHGVILWNTAGSTTITEKLSWTPAHVEDMYGNDSAVPATPLHVGEAPLLLCE